MSAFIQKLKQKPEDVKNRIAIFSAIVITLLIVGAWILVMKNQNTDKVVNERSAGETLKPLFMIFGNAKDGFGSLKADVNSNN